MTSLFRTLSDSDPQPITSVMQVYSDSLIDISDGLAEMTWSPGNTYFNGNINVEPLGAIAASLVGSAPTSTNFTTPNTYTATLAVDAGAPQAILLNANYTNFAGVVAALNGQTEGATWTHSSGTLTLTSDSSGLLSELDWDGTADAASDINVADDDVLGVNPNNLTFHYPGIYAMSFHVSVGDETGSSLSDPETFGLQLDTTGSANFSLSASVSCAWDSMFVGRKNVGSYMIVAEAGDSMIVNVSNPEATADRSAEMGVVITRIDANPFAAYEQPPLP